jgi:hypothetical protein
VVVPSRFQAGPQKLALLIGINYKYVYWTLLMQGKYDKFIQILVLHHYSGGLLG